MRKAPVPTGPDRRNRILVSALSSPEYLPLIVLIFLILTSPAFGSDTVAPRNILILYSFSDPSVQVPADLLKSKLRSRAPSQINFEIQYLETRRFDDENYEKNQVEDIRLTFGVQKPDLVIAVSYPALDFAEKYRHELFPEVPLVFTDVDASRIVGQKMWPGVTGVTETVDVRGTIELALHLHPRVNTVAVVTNTSPFDKYWLSVVHAELVRRKDNVKEIDLVGVPPDKLMEHVAVLPPQTVILFQEAPQESFQPAIGTFDVLATLGQRFPTYCIFPVVCLSHGGIGGADFDYEEQASLVADLAQRVLSGERPENIPIVHGSADQIRVDWRQLRRWNIPESALPPGSEVLYREPTFWQRDRKYVTAALLVILVQLLLILGLLWQRARKRKAEAVLRESEKRFRVMADTTPTLVWMCDRNGKITYLNNRRVEFTGPDPKAGYGDTWAKYIHPDDRKGVLDILSQALQTPEPFSNEYRLRRYDGTYRWMFDIASPRVNGDGSFAGFIGSAVDVTDQKVAQEALEKVSGQLIEAQEKERSRIARDLHDDICQRLALLSMELEQANRSLNGSSEAANKRLEEIQLHCSEIAGDVQALSHQLHSSKLDYLGIVAAIRGFCKEFAKQHDVSVDFKDGSVPRHLPKDVSLCLFRVAQEALHNAVKYSGATQFALELRKLENEIQMEIVDKGVGFDVEAAKGERGLGLVSMQERVHLVRGRFSVESAPGKGTRIVAAAPLPSETAADSAEGADNESASVTGAA